MLLLGYIQRSSQALACVGRTHSRTVSQMRAPLSQEALIRQSAYELGILPLRPRRTDEEVLADWNRKHGNFTQEGPNINKTKVP
eukprot:1141144-Pelagomonas_calceolata.AAC.2